MGPPTIVDLGGSWKNPGWRTSVPSRFSFSRMTFNANAKGLRLIAGVAPRVRFHLYHKFLFTLPLFASALFAQSKTLYISKHYLNIPVSRASKMNVFQIQVDGI